MTVISGDTYAERAIAGTLAGRDQTARGAVSRTDLTAVQTTANAALPATKIQTRRITTGSIAATTSAEVTVGWTTSFGDTNYTVSAHVLEGTATTDTLRILKIVSQSATQVVIRVRNDNASARTGTLHVVGIHD